MWASKNQNLDFKTRRWRVSTLCKRGMDIEYEFPFGWSEIEGVHNRTDYDLLRHQEFSKKNLSYFDQANNERFLPYIIETSAGLNRMLLTVLTDAYWEDEKK